MIIGKIGDSKADKKAFLEKKKEIRRLLVSETQAVIPV